MDRIIDEAIARGIASAELQAAVLVVLALAVTRWLWLGIRADWARWRARAAKGRGPSGEHAEAFDRGMQRLLAELDARPAPGLTALRRAA
jgi:hypothetical protein